MEYKDISVRVYVVGDPEVKTIKPPAGVHAGEETAVLNFRAVERKYKKESDGTRKPADGVFYSIRLFGDMAETIGALIQDGMLLQVEGSFNEREYTTIEGEKRTDNVINADAYKIYLPLFQSGVKSIDFEKKKKKAD